MKAHDFILEYPIFTVNQFKNVLRETRSVEYGEKDSSFHNLLSYHLHEGHIGRVHRGLYQIEEANWDGYKKAPYFVACKMAPDAIIAYHTALGFYG